MDELLDWLIETRAGNRKPGRPLVTITYAQSLDGCLALGRGQPSALSGEPARAMTHMLRAAHDAILVGIGTLLADNPQLNVRFAEGDDPQPVVLDSHLRTSLECALMQRKHNLPWLAALQPTDATRRSMLEGHGARVIALPADATGRVSLPHLLATLDGLGIRSLMVEGGAGVLTSFLVQRLADVAVITIAPVFLGGMPLMTGTPGQNGLFPELENIRHMQLGEDTILYGTLGERGM